MRNNYAMQLESINKNAFLKEFGTDLYLVKVQTVVSVHCQIGYLTVKYL